MSDITSSGTSVWSGDWHHGSGTLSTVEHDTVGNVPFSYASRFDGAPGASPEELFAAAYAGCLNQALANTLSWGNFTAENIQTTVTVTLGMGERSPTFSGIHITLTAAVPVINQVQFSALANAAKNGCLISRLLSVEPTMTATLESP
jgi:osmotically inducible protein OsmC